MTTLTTHQVNCLSYAICNTDSKINFSAALKDINGTRTIRALINKYYLVQYETAEGTVTVVTQSGLDALIAHYNKVGHDYDAKVVEQTYFDHFAADHENEAANPYILAEVEVEVTPTIEYHYVAPVKSFNVGDTVTFSNHVRDFYEVNAITGTVAVPTNINGYVNVRYIDHNDRVHYILIRNSSLI